jgi:hypothetical protein
VSCSGTRRLQQGCIALLKHSWPYRLASPGWPPPYAAPGSRWPSQTRSGGRAAPDTDLVRADLVLTLPYPNPNQVPIALAYKRDAVRLDGTDALVLNVYGAHATPIDPPMHTLADPELYRAAAAVHDVLVHPSVYPNPMCSAGAYGTPNDAEWDAAAVSLLERGVIHAIAGVRGGGERGQFWYEGGRLLAKNNTFADAVAAAEHLIAVRAGRGARSRRGASRRARGACAQSPWLQRQSSALPCTCGAGIIGASAHCARCYNSMALQPWRSTPTRLWWYGRGQLPCTLAGAQRRCAAPR